MNAHPTLEAARTYAATIADARSVIEIDHAAQDLADAMRAVDNA